MFALNMLKASDVNPERVTHQVLEMCNVIRKKQEVLGPNAGGSDFMRKRTGTGGCGGRQNAADMQLGSVGFRERQLAKRQQKPAMNWSQFNLHTGHRKDNRDLNTRFASVQKPRGSQRGS